MSTSDLNVQHTIVVAPRQKARVDPRFAILSQSVTTKEKDVRLYLIRHGETEYNKQRMIQGHTEVPLNATGIAQAKLMARRMAEAHPDQIIPGEELKTAEGIDVIGLYLTEEIPKGTPARETIERVREQGGISYLPHPYSVAAPYAADDFATSRNSKSCRRSIP